MKKQFNEELKTGDKIMIYHMEGELSVPPGTTGTVRKITSDPFEDNQFIISVKWDNGSTLSLISSTDVWKKIDEEPKKIEESKDSDWEFITNNADLFENFDWRWFRQFLSKIRDSGIINMFGSSPLLYAGKEHIDRYYGEGRENDRAFQEVLEDAEESKHKIIQGVIKYMQKENKDLDNMGMVNRFADHFSKKILGLYMVFSNITGSRS